MVRKPLTWGAYAALSVHRGAGPHISLHGCSWEHQHMVIDCQMRRMLVGFIKGKRALKRAQKHLREHRGQLQMWGIVRKNSRKNCMTRGKWKTILCNINEADGRDAAGKNVAKF